MALGMFIHTPKKYFY